MKLRIILILMTVFSVAKSGDLKYPVSTISEELKKDVDVVVREDYMRFTILSKNKSRHYVRLVFTIFNERGNHYATHQVDYDKQTKVLDISGAVYDATGKQIKKLKNKEIRDQASFGGDMTLFSDDRIKILDLSQAIYPYTVEIEYEVENDFLYSIPSSWWGGKRISYEQASYQLIFPTDLAPHYKLFNSSIEPIIRRMDNGAESVTWILQNLKPISFEPHSAPTEQLVPHILAAPDAFEYEGYAGDMSTWKEYGMWQLKVNNGRDDLSEETKAKAKELVKGMTSIEEKTKALYEFLQNRTRYVNIVEGIGGLQPFPASAVDKLGYGDCKALSNFMVTLLKQVGVKAFYTKIYAGEDNRQIVIDFPSHQTNHVVVSVPNGRDTLWLECTDQTQPFGYQGTFTEDRWALMITEEGGKLVRTPNYKPEQNLQSRTAIVSIDVLGNATARVKTTFKGIQYENGGLNWVFSSSDKQQKWIERNTDIPNFKINSFSMKEVRDKVPSAIVNLDLTLNRYASVSGKRVFVTPNLMNRMSYVPEKMTDRKTDVVTKSNFIDQDTIILSIPENLYPEFLPQPVKINSKFGEYEANFKFDAGKVIYTRRLKMWKCRLPKESYNELVDFYKNVSKADNTKLVFLNKT